MTDQYSRERPLVRLYAQYISEPESIANAYGYWIFLLGFVVGLLGFGLYLVAPAAQTAGSAIREAMFVLGGLALPLILLGIVLMLPVRRVGLHLSGLGFITAALGVLWFIFAYPENWVAGLASPTLEIVLVYGAGIALIGLTAILVPFVTGKRSWLVDDGQQSAAYSDGGRAVEVDEAASRPIVLGDSLRDGLFAVHRENDRWRWRLLDERAIAGSAADFVTDVEAVEGVESVKRYVEAADLLEYKDAAFRLHPVDQNTWNWKLVDDRGEAIAEASQSHGTRGAAMDSVHLLSAYGPDARLQTVENAFHLYTEDGDWRWQLLDENRNELLVQPVEYGSRESALESVSTVQSAARQAGTVVLDDYAVELYENGGWSWRLLDRSGSEVAESSQRFESRSNAETRAGELLHSVGNAPVIEAQSPTYEVITDEQGNWYWRLTTAEGDVLGHSHTTADESATAETWASQTASHIADANVFTIEAGSFEIYPVGGSQWSWRLIDDDRREVAESPTSYVDREAAESAVRRLKELVGTAELLEFDGAAFQLYEADGSEWRWRLIDATGEELTDSSDHYSSRQQAAATIPTLKEYAPEAEIIEIESAAFELFENSDGEWNWRLVDKRGETVARGQQPAPTRADARERLDSFKAVAEASQSYDMERAAFHLYPNEKDDWEWRLIRPDASVFAKSASSYSTLEAAEARIEEFRRDSAQAETHVIAGYIVQIVRRDDGWQWRIVDESRRPYVKGRRAYDTQSAAVEEVESVHRQADSMDVFSIDQSAFVAHWSNGKWDWRLVDADWSTLGKGAETHRTREGVREAIDQAQDIAVDAAPIYVDGAAFRMQRDTNGWRWVLVDEDERIVAKGTELHRTQEGAQEAVATVKRLAGDANVLDIDPAAFEVHYTDDGWRWRLIDNTGDVLATSITAFSTRQDAREQMRLVQDHGPTAHTTVAE